MGNANKLWSLVTISEPDSLGNTHPVFWKIEAPTKTEAIKTFHEAHPTWVTSIEEVKA